MQGVNEMMMTKPNIILIGMAGTSKTTTGKALAEKRDAVFYDGDVCFNDLYGDIPTFFERYGEGAFRIEESKILYDLSRKSGAVIACGGGAVLSPSMRFLADSGIVVWLTATADTIFERLKSDESRPLLKGGGKERIAALAKEREPLYKRYANATVATDGLTVGQTVHRIETLIAPIIDAKTKIEDE